MRQCVCFYQHSCLIIVYTNKTFDKRCSNLYKLIVIIREYSRHLFSDSKETVPNELM